MGDPEQRPLLVEATAASFGLQESSIAPTRSDD